jgi:type I restriction enzyme M protein
MLKDGGRMAVVLPQGRFNNSSDKHIREFIAENCRILAVIGLHPNTFQPHTGTKTSVLLVQKWTNEMKAACTPPSGAGGLDYPIFFATQQKPAKDVSGEKLFLKNENKERRLDEQGHPTIDHDLFSITLENGTSTPEGIAEAFIEFAKKEKLSFYL